MLAFATEISSLDSNINLRRKGLSLLFTKVLLLLSMKIKSSLRNQNIRNSSSRLKSLLKSSNITEINRPIKLIISTIREVHHYWQPM